MSKFSLLIAFLLISYIPITGQAVEGISVSDTSIVSESGNPCALSAAALDALVQFESTLPSIHTEDAIGYLRKTLEGDVFSELSANVSVTRSQQNSMISFNLERIAYSFIDGIQNSRLTHVEFDVSPYFNMSTEVSLNDYRINQAYSLAKMLSNENNAVESFTLNLSRIVYDLADYNSDTNAGVIKAYVEAERYDTYAPPNDDGCHQKITHDFAFLVNGDSISIIRHRAYDAHFSTAMEIAQLLPEVLTDFTVYREHIINPAALIAYHNQQLDR